jgi:hypothetical protein
MHGPETDAQPVPDVDQTDCDRQLDHLVRRELGAKQVVVLVRGAGLGDAGQSLRPGQRGTLTVGEQR